MDYQILRDKMLQEQFIDKGITDKAVLNAMSKVKRHLFVAEALAMRAYGDYPLPIGNNQTISQPYMVAFMTQALHISPQDIVLEIGTGSGYQTAVLSMLCKKVYSIERIEDLARKAKQRLDELGYHNIEIKAGDGTYGWKEKSPFNAILVTAGSPGIPKSLTHQLAEGGRLVIPVGDKAFQSLKIVTKINGALMEKDSIGCIFVKLIGHYGWPELG
ncbi:MAG: protein-L-isoaspartate(D-aspartate) O-methyltransferase [bacterium]